MNVLGMPIFIDYYTIHDPEKGTIGWAPHTKSSKSAVKSGDLPPQNQLIKFKREQGISEEDELPVELYTTIVQVWFTLIFIIMFIDCVKCCAEYCVYCLPWPFLLVLAIFYWILAVLVLIELKPAARDLVLYMIELFAGARPRYTNSIARLVNNTVSFKGLDENMLGISIGIMLAYMTLKVLSKVWIAKKND